MGKTGLRRHLMAFTACGLVASLAPMSQALAQQASPTADAAVPPKTEQIRVSYKKRLLKERNSPTAVTELGEKDIAAVGINGSTASLLRQAPSVFVYQQGIGQNSPVFSVRGVRGLEVAQTLDGVPMQDLIYGGTGSYLTNNISSQFGLDQISSTEVEPGVAFPNESTFGTIGGTINYSSKRPSAKAYIDLFGSVGSFGTSGYGFEANSGRLDTALGTGDNAMSVLLRYSTSQTAGYINYTDSRYGNLLFSVDKPYDDGQSIFQATAIYNYGRGYLQNQPTPIADMNTYGRFTNYSKSDAYLRQTNDFGTLILKNDTQVNDMLKLGVTAFYLMSDDQTDSYENNKYFQANNVDGDTFGTATSPFAQLSIPDFFTTSALGTSLYTPGLFTYDPTIFGNSNSCYSCGVNYQTIFNHYDTYGIQPRGVITLENPFIDNLISFGGLAAKETNPGGGSYIYGAPNGPTTDGYNSLATMGGGAQRTIYQVYVQDRIDLLNKTLHITPGVTAEYVYSSNRQVPVAENPTLNDTVQKFDRAYLPFLNVSYDLDRVFPLLAGTSFYASYGKSALFAPVSDFTFSSVSNTTLAPNASVVNFYEAGFRYDTSNVLFTADYFYQKVDRDLGFFQGQGALTNFFLYNNNAAREFKGLEATAQYRLTTHWTLKANMSYVIAKNLKTDLASSTIQEDQFGVVFKDTPISGVPDWLSNFSAEYDNKNIFMDGDSVSARLSGQYTGQQYTTVDSPVLCGDPQLAAGCPLGNSPVVNGVAQPVDYTKINTFNGHDISNFTPFQKSVLFPASTITNESHKLPEFAIFNLDLTYVMPLTIAHTPAKQVTFDLNIQNLFDQRYNQYYYNQVIAYGGHYQSNAGHLAYSDAIPGEPFSMIFTTTVRF